MPGFAGLIISQNQYWRPLVETPEIKLAPEKLSEVAKKIEDFLLEPIKAIKNDYKFNKFWKWPGPWRKEP